MATSAIVPHTRIDNSIIDDLASQIGIYGLGIYVAIKRHLNTKTGECYPSYQTIACKLGIDRSTVIRYVKKLKALNLLSPLLRFKEDGSPTSNQYNFQPAENPAPSKNIDESVQIIQGGGTKPLPVVGENTQPSSTEPPKQSEPNKKQRTITDVDFFPTNPPLNTNKSPINSHICPSIEQLKPTIKQQTCPHPPTEIVFLADNVTICHHCYGLLDENLTLKEERRSPLVENVAA